MKMEKDVIYYRQLANAGSYWGKRISRLVDRGTVRVGEGNLKILTYRNTSIQPEKNWAYEKQGKWGLF